MEIGGFIRYYDDKISGVDDAINNNNFKVSQHWTVVPIIKCKL